MNNIKQIYLLLALGLSLSLCSCDKTNMVLIRIENVTGHDITDVFVQGPENEHNYGKVKAGKKSEYKTYEKAYRYAFCSFNIDGEEFRVQPIDFFGEELLKSGKYTYRLMINDLETPWASMELVD